MIATVILFLVDTNILVYMYDSADEWKRQRARQVIALLEAQRRGAFSSQILGEFFVNVTRKVAEPLTYEQAERQVEILAVTWPVFDLTADIVYQAMRYTRLLQLSYWDALLIATARANGVTMILSEDLNDGQVYDGIRVRNPLAAGFDLALLD